jgi:uncharacterized membrane protein YeaQ/YmgE (transglycosylase-associated protein family)
MAEADKAPLPYGRSARSYEVCFAAWLQPSGLPELAKGMALVALILGAIVARVLLARYREQPASLGARTLGREFGVRPSGTDGRYTRRDRLWAAAASGGGACAAFALTIGAFMVAERFPNLSTTNHVFTGVGFVAAILGALAVLATLAHLVAAPFARAAGVTPAADRQDPSAET